jgi:hypothetical protein
MDLPATQMNARQHIVRHQPTQCPDLSGAEVGSHQHLQTGAGELLPRRGRLALWRRWDVVALADIARGLVTHGVLRLARAPTMRS